jgi:predicted lipoprotein with Yx(FWY)xxD motif
MRRPAAPPATAALAALAALALAALAGCASATDRPATAVVVSTADAAAAPSPLPLTVQLEDSPTLGRVLADLDGHTLYRYDLDTATAISCTGTCTTTRKPLVHHAGDPLRLPPGIAGTLTTVQRPESEQVAYDNSPLYRFTGDHQPGDTFGESLQWHVITPQNLPAR